MLSRILPLKTDAGSGALEQMVLAEYCAPHFAPHVPELRRALRAKLETLMEALAAQFGTAAEFDDPKGGIFLGSSCRTWSIPKSSPRRRSPRASPSIRATNGRPTSLTAGAGMRLCFANPSHEQIREGVAVLAEVCRRDVRRARSHCERRARQAVIGLALSPVRRAEVIS